MHSPLADLLSDRLLPADMDKSESVTRLKQPTMPAFTNRTFDRHDTNEVPDLPFSPVLLADPSLIVRIGVGHDVEELVEQHGAEVSVEVIWVHKNGELFGP